MKINLFETSVPSVLKLKDICQTDICQTKGNTECIAFWCWGPISIQNQNISGHSAPWQSIRPIWHYIAYFGLTHLIGTGILMLQVYKKKETRKKQLFPLSLSFLWSHVFTMWCYFSFSSFYSVVANIRPYLSLFWHLDVWSASFVVLMNGFVIFFFGMLLHSTVCNFHNTRGYGFHAE